jgi:DNA-binding NarL/FixJ family response regulator
LPRRANILPAGNPQRASGGDGLLRLLLVEDHVGFRGALAMVLNLQPGMEVVAECGSLSECRALEGLENVDVALVDLNLPDGEGTEFITVLRGANPVVRVLMLSASIEAGLRERAAAAGADGVLDKMTPLPQLASEVRHVAGVGGA